MMKKRMSSSCATSYSATTASWNMAALSVHKSWKPEILHMIDNIDAEMMMMITALDKVAPGEMTNRIFAMDNRTFYKPNVD